MEDHNCFNKQQIGTNPEDVRIYKNEVRSIWFLEISDGEADDECWILETPISHCPYCGIELA